MIIFAFVSLPSPSFSFNASFFFLLLLPETSIGLLAGFRLLNLIPKLLSMFFLVVPVFEELPILIVLVKESFLSLCDVCFHVSPATLMLPTAFPLLLGSSSQYNSRETSPSPLTTNSRSLSLLPLNLAVTPGDDDLILNSASVSI